MSLKSVIRDSSNSTTALLVGFIGILCTMSGVVGYALSQLRHDQGRLQCEIASELGETRAALRKTDLSLVELRLRSHDALEALAIKANASDLRRLETIFLHDMASIKETLAAELTSQAAVPTSPRNAPAKDQDISLFDLDDMHSVATNLTSDDAVVRERALQVLALVGTVEERRRLISTLTDTEEDVLLRRQLIATMNWQGLGNELAQMVDGEQHPEVFDALVSAAEHSILQLGAEDRISVSDALTSAFSRSTNDEVKVRIVDYFANTDPDVIDTLALPWDGTVLGAKVTERIAFVRAFLDR